MASLYAFCSEVIWQELKPNETLLLISEWPHVQEDKLDHEAEEQFNVIKDVISAIRNLRSEHKIEPSQKLKTVIYAGEYTSILEDSKNIISSLRTGVGELEIMKTGAPLPNTLLTSTHGVEIYLETIVDSEKERIRLTKEIEHVQKGIVASEQKLSNPEFTDKAPANIILLEEKKLQDYRINLEKFLEQLKNI